jgi:hypothetical protein
MDASISNLPNWLRWTLLVPASLVGGFLAGYLIYLVNASLAASPTAPIIFIAEFLGGLASNLAAFHIAYILAPSHQRTAVAAFVAIGFIASLDITYVFLENEDYSELFLVAGNMTACYVAWRKYLREAAS